MRKLELKENSNVLGGDWEARYYKQIRKCARGNNSSCKRAMRMLSRLF